VALHEAALQLGDYLRERAGVRDLADFLERTGAPGTKRMIQEIIAAGQQREAYDAALQRHRPALQAAYRNCFEHTGIAALAYPTTALPAAPAEAETVVLNGAPVPVFAAYLRNVDPASNAGLPGLSLPIGATREGLPVGLALDAAPGADEQLLALGIECEKALRLA
jgi:mandelamide amidase